MLICSVVCVLTGGNIDAYSLSRCVDRGLAVEGRLIKFSVRNLYGLFCHLYYKLQPDDNILTLESLNPSCYGPRLIRAGIISFMRISDPVTGH